jgi:type I restriction enzyme, S subunit
MKWEKYKIEELCEIKGGKRLPANHELLDVFTNHPYIRARDIGNGVIDFNKPVYLDEKTHYLISRYIVKKDDIVITIVGANIGDVGLIPIELDNANLTENAVKLTSFNEKCHFKYLLYFFLSPGKKHQIQQISAGSAQGKLGIYKIKEIEVILPPLSIQRKIASILSAYDDMIENNLKRIKLLEEKAFLRYKEIVRSEKMEEYFIENVCETIGGGTPSTGNPQFWADGNILWFSPTDLTKHNSFVLLDSEKKISELGLQKSSAKLVPPKTILMTSRASIGYFGLINKPVSTNQGFINIIPHKEFYRAYILFDLKSRKDEIIGNANGSTFLEISKSKFRQMKIRVPKNELVLMEFESEFDIIFNFIENLLKQNAHLRQARDILLPKLMSGEIAV